MKRFYCTVCGRIKRTQEWPINRSFDTHPDFLPYNVDDRIASCNRHSALHQEKVASFAEVRRHHALKGAR